MSLCVYATVVQGTDNAALVSQSPALDVVMNPGQSFTATWRMRNTGTTTWTAGVNGYTLNFVSGERLGAPQHYITLSSPVAPNGEANFSTTLTAPTTPGTYTGTWRMNNASSQFFGPTVPVRIVVQGLPPQPELLPDLVVSALNGFPSPVTPGQRLSVTFTVLNTGAGAAPETPAHIRLAGSPTILPSDPLLAQATIGALAPGQSRPVNVVVTIPAATAPGGYYLGVTANATGPVREANSNNNERVTPITVQAGSPPIVHMTGSGFVYPLGRSGPYAANMPGWLAGGPGYGVYRSGYYHLGQDMEANAGDAVYAIAAGEIVWVSTGGWGVGNYGLLVRHRLADGQEFIAVYGHVRPVRAQLQYSAPGPVSPPIPVGAGEVFATVGPADYVAYWDTHLHFGIRPGGAVPPAPYGLMALSNWPDVNGFVDPMAWLTTRTPAQGLGAPGSGQTRPPAPRNLTAQVVVASPAKVALSWESGAANVLGFVVERRAGPGGVWEQIAQLAGGIRQFVDPLVELARTYYYRVWASHPAGPSDYSNEASVTMPQANVLTPVIDRVEPAEPSAGGSPQALTVYGRNFAPNAVVNLRHFDGTPGGQLYPNRTVSSRSDTHLTINPNFGSRPGRWSVEVVNPGLSPVSHAFEVVLPPIPDLLPTDGFDYPIGNRGYSSDGGPVPLREFPDANNTDAWKERNDLFPSIPIGADALQRERIIQSHLAGIANRFPTFQSMGNYRSGFMRDGTRVWYNFQDAGAYLGEYNGVSYNGLHAGEDWNYLGGDEGKPVYACARGRIVSIRKGSLDPSGLSRVGWIMILVHNVPARGYYYSIYEHVTTYSFKNGEENANGVIVECESDFYVKIGDTVKQLKVGDIVERGFPIARIGAITLGSHLHFEIRERVRDLANEQIYPPNLAPRAYYQGDTPQNAVSNMIYDGILDPSDFIDDNRPLSATGWIKNGIFVGAHWIGWGLSGNGSLTIAELLNQPNPNWARLLLGLPTGGSQSIDHSSIQPAAGESEHIPPTMSLHQSISTPPTAFELRFDHLFRTTNGTLDVLLNGHVLVSLPAPATLPEEPGTATVTVRAPELFSLQDAVLEFRFTGEEGSEALLSNIMLSQVQPWVATVQWSDVRLSTNGFEATLVVGVPGNYHIERSEDLVSWTPVLTATNVIEAFRFVDRTIAAKPRAFYRAVPQP